MQLRDERRTWAATVAVLAVSAAALSLHLRIGLNLDDEGLVCDYALRLLGGQRPYVDFVPPYELGRYLLVAGAFEAIGPSVVVARGVFVAMLALAAALTHRVALRCLPGLWALAPAALVTLLPAPLWKSDLPLGLAAATLGALRYAEAPSWRRAAAAGAVAGLLALDRPDLPVYAALVLLAAAPIPPWRQAAAALGAACAAVVPLFAALAAWPGALAGWLEAHLWMTQLSGQFSLPLPAPWRAPEGVVNGALYYAGPLLAAITAVVLLRRPRPLAPADVALRILAVGAAAAWHQIWIRANWGHVLQASWPVWVLGPALTARAIASLRAGAPRRAAVGAGVTLWVLICVQAMLAITPYAGMRAAAEGRAVRTGWPRADVWLPPSLARELGALVARLRERGAPVLVLPYGPMLNFLADVPSPTFLTNVIPGRLDERGQQRVIDDLERTRTPTVLLGEKTGARDAPLPEYAPLLWSYLQQRYRVVATGPWLVLERAAAP